MFLRMLSSLCVFVVKARLRGEFAGDAAEVEPGVAWSAKEAEHMEGDALRGCGHSDHLSGRSPFFGLT